ncbi:MAG TPA: sialate O-acetylesterase [Polyangiaceae bacterium]|nr:sialate O-acetylesterase [Polyangiaceae bacterium]
MVHIAGLRKRSIPAVLGLILAGCTSASDGSGTDGPASATESTSTMGGTTGGATTTGGAGPSTGAVGPTTGGMTTGSMTTGGMTTGNTTTGSMTTGNTTTGSMTTGGVDAATGSSGGAASVGTGAGGDSSSGGVTGTGGSGGTFDGKELFILIGQSNMSGMSPMPSEPWPINERVTFMVQFDCDSLGQTAGEWLPAEPPLHGCQWATGGIGLGLADFFGAKLAEEWPDSNIGLVPNAIPGQLISIYLKEGGTSAPVPPGYANAYEMTVERSRKAQEQGRIRAILMHQGESDDNQMMSDQWLGRVATVIADLRADLNLGEEVPFLAGQIGPSQWQKHNAYVDQIPDYVPNSAVVSAEGTAIHDIAHFDEASAKIMGERYVEKFLEMVPQP